MADNIKTTKAINDLLAARQKVIKGTNQELTKQVALQRDLCNAIECADTDIFENLRNSTKDAAQAAKEAEDAYKNTSDELVEMGKQADRTGGAFQKLKGFFKGFATGMAVGIVSVIGIVSEFYKSYKDSLYKTIAALERVQQAQEQVRGKFGSLTSGPGQMVVKDANAMGSAFAEMGVSAGYGYDATINLINKMSELYSSMNPAQMAGFATMTQESRIEMGKFALAAGFSGEEIGQLNNTFRAMGEDSVSAMADIAVRSQRLKKTLGISAKSANKAFLEMTRNVKAFGNANRSQMESAMSKATQLGISIKDLSGISDAFFTFDKAAEGVSKLSQAFGTQIDVMKMVGAATPADQLDQMREAMFKAGKSAESMSRHELALLAQTTGLSEEAARLAFSQESQYMSQEELNKKIGDTDPQKQMANAMKEVAKEIENVVVKLTDMVDAGSGPLSAFMQGITQGMFFFGEDAQESAGSFKEAITTIVNKGVELGKWLRKNFAPLQDLFGGVDGALSETPELFDKLSTAIQAMVAPLNTAYYLFKAFFIEDDPAKRGEIFDEMLNQISLSFKFFSDKMFGPGGAGKLGEKIGDFLGMAISALVPKVLDFMMIALSTIAKATWNWFKGADTKTQIGAVLMGIVMAFAGGLGKVLLFLPKMLWKAVKLIFRGGKALGGLFSKMKLPKLTMFTNLGKASKLFAPLLRGLGFIAKRIPVLMIVMAAFKPIIGLIKDISVRIKEAVGSSNGFIDTFVNLGKIIPGVLGDLVGRFLEFAVNLADSMTFGLFSDILKPEEFSKQWDLFVLEIGDLWVSAKQWGVDIMGSLKDGLVEAWDGISAWFRDAWDELVPDNAFTNFLFEKKSESTNSNKSAGEAAAARVSKSSDKIQEAIGKATRVSGKLSDLQAAGEEMNEVFSAYAKNLSNISNMFAGTTTGGVDVDILTARVAKVGAAMAQMASALAEVDTATLRAKIEEIAGTALFGEDSIESNKFIINLNVVMEADKVADVLVRERLVAGV